MNKLRSLLVPSALVLLAGCANYSIKYDFDPTASFQAYRTFDWQSASKQAKGKEEGSAILNKRIRLAIEREMAAKGYRQETKADPDFLLSYHPVYQNRQYRTTTTVGAGWRWHPWGIGTATHISEVHHYKEGSIVLQIVDFKSGQPVWEGVAEGALTGLGRDPEDVEEQIGRAVRQLLDRFPPERRNR